MYLKQIVKINGFFGFTPEGRAVVQVGDKLLMTSTVQNQSVHGSIVYIETQNSIYTNYAAN